VAEFANGLHVLDHNYLTTCFACPQASETRCAELTTELGVVRDELARTSAVAARVAANEAKAIKMEGTVPAVCGSLG